MVSIAKKVGSLRSKIRQADIYYYQKSDSLVSDFDYDGWMKELGELVKKFPQLDLPDCPTHRVGSDLSSGFPKVEHSTPMLSIDNIFSDNDYLTFLERIRKALFKKKITMVAELKLDGLAISLIYEKGNLVLAKTRGDGKLGDDVTLNAFQIKGIPKKIPIAYSAEVRGEIYLSRSKFEKMNETLSLRGEKVKQNPPQRGSGLIKIKKS